MNRIVSLIASSTETVCALGFEDQLVGRSHACDYPPSVLELRICSEAKFDLKGTSSEIDERVRRSLDTGDGVYRTHGNILRRLNPTLIITQDYGDDRFWIMGCLAGLRYIGERSIGGDEGYDCGDCDMLGVHFTYSPVVNCFVFQGTEEVFFVLYVPSKPRENYRRGSRGLRVCNF